MCIRSPTYQQSAYLSAIAATNISRSFAAHKMAAKINWHRYGTKLRHYPLPECPVHRACSLLYNCDWPTGAGASPDQNMWGGQTQGGYIFYAGASLAGAGYCRQCRRRPAILPLQLWQGCQVCVKISAQRLPRVAEFSAC